MAIITNLTGQAFDNVDFRKVIDTSKNTQVVIMSIPAGSDIGSETHDDNDQLLYLVEGKGTVVLNGQESPYNTGDAVLVPAGTEHNFISDVSMGMKIITAYSPPHHPVGTIHTTKADAEKAEY